MKKICDLIDCEYDFNVLGISDDSRNVQEGFLFVCTKGYYVDHFDFIDDAILNGAICIVADRKVDNCVVPVIVVDNINDCYTELCRKYYDVNLDEFSFIGITGTDGKTTTTTVIYQLLNYIKDSSCACIGTNGLLISDKNVHTSNTTPNAFELFNCLNCAKENRCKDVVMEVSSEALLHDRVKSVSYDTVGFTNITEDHLNVHGTVENYRKSKFKLLDLVKSCGKVIVNGDDEICRLIDVDNMYTFGVNKDNDFVICNVKEMSDCVEFSVEYGDETFELSSPLLGMYNVYNVTMAFIICLLKGNSVDRLIQGIKQLKPIEGRREYLNFGQSYDIVLDYAHTYNGIKNILESVSGYNRIITVTGAAGGREKEKRPKIGKLVLEKSDITIFTMDDPRFERVDDIINQMIGNSGGDYLKIIDRREAIFKALSLAGDGDVVFILGKGRDNYMAIEDRREAYCDYDVIVDYFNK